jgi:hypothetical protein
MKERFIELTNKEIKIYDADTTLKELVFEFCVNFFYAYVANVTTPFIVQKYDMGVFVGFFIYYYFLSYILNRDKYESKFGRYILLPVPCVLGAFASYKTGYLIFNLFS